MYVCRLKHPDVFDLIQRHNLWHALLNNLMNLLELDVEVSAYNNILSCVDEISTFMYARCYALVKLMMFISVLYMFIENREDSCQQKRNHLG